MAFKRFPSVAGLRGFEACVRHLNFSQAAAELHVTQSAISHQIRQLEELLGVELFERTAGVVTLTAHGAELLPVVRVFLKDMGRLVDRFEHSRDQGSVLEVFVHDSFAQTWLIPRLSKFYHARPDIRLKLNTDEFSRFENPNAQVAIRLAEQGANWSGLYAELILRERIFPVCSPALVEAQGIASTPADILKYPLIVRSRSTLNGQQVSSPSWDYWLHKHGLSGEPFDCALTVPHTSIAVQAALRGLGVAMARTSHIFDELDSGVLQKPVMNELVTTTGYYFLCAAGKEKAAAAQAFLEWLKTEMPAPD
ncbi:MULTISPECIES: LysR substrate-binding domain-containing protein [unclassified Pseudomonas]|uniref:LysR substrate-binding domain-containing protein n=1 Tax=unclassified Pseudomonas TaxID=196821 RepID=UPI0025EB4127|nr:MULTISPECIES: LysR substrate-binding domain-containing protein [unclassified Pseudomonas]